MSESRDVILKINEAEKELMDARNKVVELRRAVPKNSIDDYAFGTQYGDVLLSALFGEKSDLIIIHNTGIDCRF